MANTKRRLRILGLFIKQQVVAINSTTLELNAEKTQLADICEKIAINVDRLAQLKAHINAAAGNTQLDPVQLGNSYAYFHRLKTEHMQLQDQQASLDQKVDALEQQLVRCNRKKTHLEELLQKAQQQSIDQWINNELKSIETLYLNRSQQMSLSTWK